MIDSPEEGMFPKGTIGQVSRQSHHISGTEPSSPTVISLAAVSPTGKANAACLKKEGCWEMSSHEGLVETVEGHAGNCVFHALLQGQRT